MDVRYYDKEGKHYYHHCMSILCEYMDSLAICITNSIHGPALLELPNILLNFLAMVMCIVLGCSKRSGRDKDISFYRVPKVITTRGKQEYELTKSEEMGS